MFYWLNLDLLMLLGDGMIDDPNMQKVEGPF